jgi:hypothetical protein
VDVHMSMGRDMRITTATRVGVDVRVKVRVRVKRGRHLDWCLGGELIFTATVVNFT